MSYTNPIVIFNFNIQKNSNQTKQNKNIKDQLDDLFDQVVQEIDDRQAYL